MSLTLTIENHASLPDGGPLSFSVTGKRGFDFGRDQHLDWCLPDPSRYISGKHCEVRYQNGEYLLYDVSTNGAFLNGAQQRMQSPHRLRTGDRLTIGDYIIAVDVVPEGGAAAAFEPVQQSTGGARELWDADGDIAPPIDPKSLRAPGSSRPVHSDFLEQNMGSPDLYDLRGGRGHDPFAEPAPAAAPAARDADFDWAPQAPRPAPVVETPPAAPSPRRAAPPPAGAGAVWSDEPESAAPATPEPAPPPAADPFLAPPAAPAAAAPAPATPAPAPPRALPVSDIRPVSAAVDGGAFATEFLARFAAGAGIPAANLGNQDALAVAQKAGEILRSVVVDMMQLLGARNEAKRLARSSNQTVIQALDNNPLKFSPTPEDALRIMLGPQTKSYLDARRALAQGFGDLKMHQVRTYSAMQAAMRMIAEELDPDALEKGLPASGGLSEMLGSRKARLWEAYVARWKAKTERHDDGLVDVFMLYFADCYDRGADGKG